MTAPDPKSLLPWAVNQGREAIARAVTLDPQQPPTLPQLAASNARCREALTTLIRILDAKETTT